MHNNSRICHFERSREEFTVKMVSTVFDLTPLNCHFERSREEFSVKMVSTTLDLTFFKQKLLIHKT